MGLEALEHCEQFQKSFKKQLQMELCQNRALETLCFPSLTDYLQSTVMFFYQKKNLKKSFPEGAYPQIEFNPSLRV